MDPQIPNSNQTNPNSPPPAANPLPFTVPQPPQNIPTATPATIMPSTTFDRPTSAAPTVGDVAPAPQTALPAGKTNPNSTQNTLQMAEVRDGIVVMNDGSFRSVVMVKSINFDLMSPGEQEGVEAGYQGFLNSLYFPVQIFIRSQKVDLTPYIQRLDKIRTEHDNMLLAMLMEDYVNYIADLSVQTNIMDKKFYVVIPYFPVTDVKKAALSGSKTLFSGIANMFSKKEQHVVVNETVLEQAKTELRNRVQAVLSGLMQCGVQGLPLDTQELIELYYDAYNPDTATRQQLKNFNDLSAPVITKGQGSARQPQLERDLQ